MMPNRPGGEQIYVRQLNLNGPAGKILAAIAILIAGAPLLLYAISLILGVAGIQWTGAALLIKGSVYLGLGLLAIFLLLLIVEQIQDALLYRRYLKNKHRRVKYSAEFAECPTCGNRRVRSFERACPVCGTLLEKEDGS